MSLEHEKDVNHLEGGGLAEDNNLSAGSTSFAKGMDFIRDTLGQNATLLEEEAPPKDDLNILRAKLAALDQKIGLYIEIIEGNLGRIGVVGEILPQLNPLGLDKMPPHQYDLLSKLDELFDKLRFNPKIELNDLSSFYTALNHLAEEKVIFKVEKKDRGNWQEFFNLIKKCLAMQEEIDRIKERRKEIKKSIAEKEGEEKIKS